MQIVDLLFRCELISLVNPLGIMCSKSVNSGVLETLCVLKIGVLGMVGSSSTVDNGSPVTYRVHPSIDPLA